MFLRVAFVLYAACVLGWLLLGALPSLLDEVSALHRWAVQIATDGGPLAGAATRLLAVDMMADPIGLSQVLVQYAFSALNLGLGVLLFVRRGDALVPRLLAFALLGTAATFNSPSHRAFHITGSPWPISLLHFSFHIASGVCYLWAIVLFPDGRLPRRWSNSGPGWWWPVGVTVLVGLICWRSSFLDHPIFFVVFFGIVVSVVGSTAQLFRLGEPGTSPAEQATARLLIGGLLPALAVSLLWLVARVVSAITSWGGFPQVAGVVQGLFPVVFALVPIVLCVGVVRYRWWGLDRLLSRLLVYSVIAGVTGLVYVVVVVACGRIAGGHLWWSVVTLALTAAAFEPLRRMAGGWANRVVYGQVTSPVQAMHSLISGLEQLTPAGGLAQVEAVTVAATRAERAQVWLLDGDRLVRATDPDVAGIPVNHADPSTVRSVDTALDADAWWPIVLGGQPLGYLAVGVPNDTRLTAGDMALIQDIATHTGLLVNNALLGVRLAREVASLAVQSAVLQSTSRRMVMAQDTERRRLERDLHDGAQQALVAALIGLRTMRTGPGAAEDLAALADVLKLARGWLVGLAGRDRPAPMVEFGLAGALRQATALIERPGLRTKVAVHQPIPVQRRGDDQDDLASAYVAAYVAAQDAVYFGCIEALQNVAKYADATDVNVDVVDDGQQIAFVVEDNGRGFEPGRGLDATGGLPQLADRLAVLGGDLVIESALGRGTRIRGSVPARPLLGVAR